jgi:hypothetical protein
MVGSKMSERDLEKPVFADVIGGEEEMQDPLPKSPQEAPAFPLPGGPVSIRLNTITLRQDGTLAQSPADSAKNLFRVN